MSATENTMPDPGHFAIHAFEAAFTISGDVERIISLTVSCRHCAEITCAQDANLLHLPGGTLFRCDACGCHQAISNARLSDWQLPPLLGA